MPEFVETQEIPLPLGTRARVHMRTDSGIVRLRGVDGPEERVTVNYRIEAPDAETARRIQQAHAFRVRSAEDGLHLKAPRRPRSASVGDWLGVERGFSVEVELALPRGVDVQVSGVSGELVAEELIGEQHYETISGDLLVAGGGGSITLSSVSGDVRLAPALPYALRANMTSGDLRVQTSAAGDLRISSVSGDVALETGLAVGAENEVESVSGDLELVPVGGLTLDVSGASPAPEWGLGRPGAAGKRRTMVFGDGRSRLRFRTVSGRARVIGGTGSPVPRPQEPATGPDDLAVLRALERGEIDVDEASRRLGEVPS